MLAVGETLREVREMRSLTVTALATKTGLTKSYVSKIERNERDPSLKVLDTICRSVGIPLNIFILLCEREPPGDFDEINNQLKEMARDYIGRSA